MFSPLSTLLFLTSIICSYAQDNRHPLYQKQFAGDFLIGLSTSCKGFDRRALIRELQFNAYEEGPFNVTWRFTVLDPNNDTIREQIMQENKTHGDIIMLDKYTDSWANANWKKPFEWFTYVEKNFPKYRYVAKMDDDTFMNITGLYEHYFTDPVKFDNNSIISAMHMWEPEKIVFPHGGFYAMTWDLMTKLNHQYATEPMSVVNALEDVQVAFFLKNASIHWRQVNLYHRSCNWKRHDNITWMSHCNVTAEHINKFANTVRVHELKDEAVYRNISSYFIDHERELRTKQKETINKLFYGRPPVHKFEGDFLIGLSTSSKDFARRALIRELQFKAYKEGPFSVTWRFTVLNPNNYTILEQIMQENKTHGDIIMLDKYVDNWANANWKKPYEWFTYVEKNMPKYRYVAKMDDDTFMNITGLYEHYFNERVRHDRNTIIAGMHLWAPEKLVFPHGGFYTMSWDLMTKLNFLYATEPMSVFFALEDVQIAFFFNNASIHWNRVNLYHRSCNWKNHDEHTWMSHCNVTYEHMNKFAEMVRVHELKDEAVYRNISSYFIEHERELRAKQLNESFNNDTSAKVELRKINPLLIPPQEVRKVVQMQRSMFNNEL